MAMTTTTLIRNADEAERRWFYGGGLHTWLVHQTEVNGGFMIFEDDVAGQVHPAAHPS